MLDFIYLFILFFLLFLFFYLFIYLFKTVTVKRKNSNTRITVDFGRLILPKKTSWTSLIATKFQKKLLRKLSVTSKNNFFFSYQVIGSGECEAHACPDAQVDDDSGLGNDNEWQIRPVAVDTTESEIVCIKDISEFKRTRAVYPVVKIK